MKKANIKKYVIFILAVIGTSLGDSLAMKGNIGTNAYEAFSLAISNISAIKVGTICFFCNLTCIVAEIILDKKVKVKYLLQIVLCYFQGMIINFIYYNLLGNLVLEHYVAKLIVTVLGMVICGSCCGLLVGLDVICFPLEGVCEVLSQKTHWDFGKVRQGADVAFVVITVLLCIIFKTNWTIREGTVIGMLILGPIMGASKKFYERHAIKEE